jgi:hypothetical protein
LIGNRLETPNDFIYQSVSGHAKTTPKTID